MSIHFRSSASPSQPGPCQRLGHSPFRRLWLLGSELLSRSRWAPAAAAMVAFLLAAQPASAVPYAVGDVFAGVGNGQIKQFSPTGTLKDTLDTTSGSTV